MYSWMSRKLGPRAAAWIAPFLYAGMTLSIAWCLLEPSDGFDYLLR